MKDPRKIAIALADTQQEDMADKITESLLQMPEHYRAPLMVFLEKALEGDADANQLRRDYAAGKLTKVELWEEMRQRYGSKDSDELVA